MWQQWQTLIPVSLLVRHLRHRQLLGAAAAVSCVCLLLLMLRSHSSGARPQLLNPSERFVRHDDRKSDGYESQMSKQRHLVADTATPIMERRRPTGTTTTPRYSSTINYGNPKFSLTPDTYSDDKQSHCKAIYGRVDVLVIFAAKSIANFYAVAQSTLQCYAKIANYHMHYIDLDNDPLVISRCRQSQVVFFRRHCAVAVYLEQKLTATDWLLVLDADTGVVNPMRCIEEYIDPRVHIIFYERLFNWEIACGNYIVRNSRWAINFLYEYADMQYEQPKNWNGFDNGALQIKILQTVYPEAKADAAICDRIWRGNDPASTQQYEIYMRYVTCVKVYLGSQRMFPGKLRIMRRGHAWVRDTHTANDQWCDKDFMMHGWKVNTIGQGGWRSPFTRLLALSECVPGRFSWPWREEDHLSVQDVKQRLKQFEVSAQKNFPKVADNLPFIHETEIADCWPHCDELMAVQKPKS